MAALRAVVDENRKLIIELPEDFPAGEVEVKLKATVINGEWIPDSLNLSGQTLTVFDAQNFQAATDALRAKIETGPSELLPLHINEDGVVRVTGTRIPLDTVIGKFNEGLTPEEIIRRFSTLRMPDVYAVIAFYLRERDTVDAYLRQREIQAEQIRREHEARYNLTGVKEKLLERLKNKEQS